MTRTQYLLAVLAEECNEVAQRAIKSIRFGLDEVQDGKGADNADRLAGELADLMGVMQMLQKEGKLPALNPEWIELKQKRVERWLHYSIQMGQASADVREEGKEDA